MAVTTSTFDLDRALNGSPIGTSAAVDETSQMTGILVRDRSFFKTNIDGKEIRLDSDGKVTACMPEDNTNYPIGTQFFMIDSDIATTYGSNENQTTHTRSDTTPQVNLSSMEPRDEFATQVLGVMLQKMDNPEAADDSRINYICRAAYRWANGMMVAAADARRGTANTPGTGTITVNQGDLQSNIEKLLYNLVYYFKQQDEEGITIKDIKKVAGSTIYKGIPIVGDGTTSAEAKPVKMEVSDVKKVAGQTIYKGIPIVGDGTTSAETKPVLTKLDKDSEIKKILEITELKKLTELTEIKKLTELTELKKLTELTEIKKLTEVTDLTNLSTDLGTINTSLGGIDTTLGNIDSDLGTIDSSIDDVATAISQNP